MSDLQTMNAVITGVRLEHEDHGMLSCFVMVEHERGHQGFGGYSLYNPSRPQDKGNYAGLFIWRVMEVAGVRDWNALIGKTVRVKADSSHIEAMGHIIKDNWFVPSEESKAMAKRVGDED